jgi:hypothetical protein
MRQYRSNIDLLTVGVERGDQARRIAADVEDGARYFFALRIAFNCCRDGSVRSCSYASIDALYAGA